MRAVAFGLTAAGMLLTVTAVHAALPDNLGAIDDEAICRAAKIGVDGPALLAFLRQRTPTADTQKHIAQLIGQLDSNRFAERQEASAKLIERGSLALPGLRAATVRNSLEVTRRAEKCIDEIERTMDHSPPAAAVRLLKVRKPDGACAALLAYLPHAANPTDEEEVLDSLVVLGVRDRKPDPLLVAALRDASAPRRGAAALVVGRFGSAEQQKDVARLLTDADPKVRLRAAHGLIAAQDKKAVATLVSLLSGAPIDLAVQAEDLLARVAGDQAPSVTLTDATDAVRRKCRDAWETWWKANEQKIDLARANVELDNDSALRARAVTRQNVAALFKSEAGTLKKTTDAPFQFSSYGIATRDDLDRGIDMLCVLLAQERKKFEKATVSLRDVDSLQAFAHKPAAKRCCKEMTHFLSQLPRKDEVRIVHALVQGIEDQEKVLLFVVVRVNGSKARVIGLDGGDEEKSK